MKKFFLLITLFLRSFSFAQQPDLVFKHLTVEDGLSQPNVQDLIQDYKGFIWICTQNGLNKYDGYKVTVYKNNPKDSTSIISNDLHHLYEDREKNLWISTTDGLDIYDRKNDCFKHFKFFCKLGFKYSDYANVIYEDQDSNIWIGTSNGIVIYKKKDESFTYYTNNPDDESSLSNSKVWSFCEDKNGNMWVATEDKLNLFNKKTKTFKHFNFATSKNDKVSNLISYMLFSRNGELVVGSYGGGLYMINTTTMAYTRYSNDPNNENTLGGNVILALLEDKKGNLWVGAENGGLNLFNPSDRSFKRYMKDLYNPYSLLNNSIGRIYEDRTGTMWVGSHNGGVNFCNPYETKFKQHKQEVNKNSVSNNNIRALIEDNQQNIWIGTDGGGVSVWNRKKNSFSFYKHDIHNINSVSTNYVLALLEDSDQNVWMGNYIGGLDKLDRKTNTFLHYRTNPEDPSSISSNTIWDIIEDEDKNLWIATREGGICMFDKKANKFVRYRHSDVNPKSIDSDWTTCLFKDSKNRIWVGTYGALNLFDAKSRDFTRYTHNDKLLNSNEVLHIHEDKKGNIWIGTPYGLNLLDLGTSTFTTYSPKSGGATDIVLSIQEDGKGHLWVSNLNEISRFNTTTRKFKSYKLKNEFLRNVDLKTRDGEIIFGGSLGYTIFNPDSIRDNPYIPPVFFTDFQIFNKPVRLGKNSPLNKNINEIKEIQLSYKASVFSFEFAALSYEGSEKNQYAYQMEGFDKEWNYINTRRNVTYTNLNPGTYNLRVKASNNDGVWNEKGTSIKIVILPPWWKSWWFRMFSVLTIALVTFIFYYIRLNSIRERNKLLEEEVKNRIIDLKEANKNLEYLNSTKDKFFSIIGHDLKGPVKALITLIDMIKLKEEISKLDETQKTLLTHIDMSSNKIHLLILSLLEWARTQTDQVKVESANISACKLLDENKELLSEQAYQKQIEIRVESSKEHQIFGDYNMVTTIVRNILNNSIKYTHPGGLIILSSSLMPEGYIKLAVADNGIGMSEEILNNLFSLDKGPSVKGTANEIGTGLGMIISHEFAELNKGRIYAESTLGKGSTFYIILPCPVLVGVDV